MAAFIRIGKNYNPITITTQGEGNKIINVEHIVHVTNLIKVDKADKPKKRVHSRIYLSTGEYIDTVDKYEDIIENIKNCGINIVPKSELSHKNNIEK